MEEIEELWKHADVGIKFKMIVYDDIVRAKLMYGLESIQLNKEYVNPLKGKLDSFHFKRVYANTNITHRIRSDAK